MVLFRLKSNKIEVLESSFGKVSRLSRSGLLLLEFSSAFFFNFHLISPLTRTLPKSPEANKNRRRRRQEGKRY